MKERFEHKSFNDNALALIRTCNEIMLAYAADGYDLSLRQLYYQLVSKNVVPNTEQSYKRVGGIVSDARLAGLLDWDMIKDRGREALANPHWDNPGDILNSAAHSFRIELWKDQPVYVEVMVEKQALEGVLHPVCAELDVTFTANKGYASSSTMYEAGKRIARRSEGKEAVVFYLGDHDPSGIDMTRDVEERLWMFSRRHVEVKRLALNMDQIEEHEPPPNPAKMSDSRASKYVEEYGDESWELDALEPALLASLVREAVERERDEDLWEKAVAKQQAWKDELRALSRKYRDEPEEDDDGDEG